MHLLGPQTAFLFICLAVHPEDLSTSGYIQASACKLIGNFFVDQCVVAEIIGKFVIFSVVVKLTVIGSVAVGIGVIGLGVVRSEVVCSGVFETEVDSLWSKSHRSKRHQNESPRSRDLLSALELSSLR